MDPANTLPHLIPLIRGGGHVVIYSPVIEPLVSLMDLYSRERRAAYISALSQRPDEAPNKPSQRVASATWEDASSDD
ncbi:tRNA (adenine(58)-N(1))-methyltransferase non-catalytic subunit trm6 [Oleoguttula sp. CCFEE 5521]